jgi:hypothetical protein
MTIVLRAIEFASSRGAVMFVPDRVPSIAEALAALRVRLGHP